MSSDFLLICEVGFGNYTVDRFALESEAHAAAGKCWCCWVLYRSSAAGTQLEELAAGGVGFAHAAVRKYAENNVKAKARDTDARAGAAAAAEARMARAAASQPKPKSKPAPSSANDGRPDVSNPATWD